MSGAATTISVIIPTRERPRELSRVMASLFAQSRPAEQIVIVDQSAQPAVATPYPPGVIYIHDPSIPSGNAARNAGTAVASGDIWLFLDDDVVLEPDFVSEILATYAPGITGVSGIITNYSKPPFGQRLWEAVFVRGPFHDERQTIYRNAEKLRNGGPRRVRHFGGGLMSFRATAIREISFNTKMPARTPGEDTDFCMRLPRGSVLVINPKARLAHYHSAVGRTSEHWTFRHAQANAYQHRRHWTRWPDRLWFAWLKLGYAIATIFASLRRGSLEPWRAWRHAVDRGMKLASDAALLEPLREKR